MDFEITEKQVTAITIPKTKSLDPVTVFLEDFSPRVGRITIICYSKVWAYMWGGMGDSTIAEFVLSCDNHYLAKNLLQGNTTETDLDEIERRVKAKLGDEFTEYEWDFSNVYLLDREQMSQLFGPEWFMDLPTRATNDFHYLFRILDVVKAGLRKHLEAVAA